MQVIPQTYLMQLTIDDVNALRRDLLKVRGGLNKPFWDGVKDEYPAFYKLFCHLPSIERFEE